MSGEPINSASSRRRALSVAVSALCAEAGFTSAEKLATESLTEILQSCLTEMGRSSKAFAELAFRTEPMVSDVVMAMVEMGLNVDSLPAYAKRTNKMILMPPTLAVAPPTHKTLQVGERKSHPPHISDHLPTFPDPHTYVRSLTHKEPTTEYQVIRERAASQKRDVERALTRFIAKTGETETLFQDDPYAFPLIANKPRPLPYLDALIPKDQDLESWGEEEVSKLTKQVQSAETAKAGAPETFTKTISAVEVQQAGKFPQDGVGGNISTDAGDTEGPIDNPYLRPIKMPKLKGTGKKTKW